MDTARFDVLARSFAGGLSRRRFLVGLGALAAGLLRVGTTAAATTCPSGQVLAAGKRCVCRLTGRPPGRGQGCPCPPGLTDTGDGLGCLACRAADCPAGPLNTTPTCADGACTYPCATGYHTCGGACVSDADPNTCGDRCTPCPDGGACAQTVEGEYVCLPVGGDVCPPHIACSGDPECGTGLSCVNGRCQRACATDADCDAYFLPYGIQTICGSNSYCVACEETSDCPAGQACLVFDISQILCVDGRICVPTT
jgi:hypothetical protein